MSISGHIGEIIQTALVELSVVGKCGQSIPQPKIASALTHAGYDADKEDSGVFLRAGMPVWRSKDTGEIAVTKARRKIDIVVRQNDRPIALIETESDLNDLRNKGVTRRNGHYDVHSIARASDGKYFDSYKSLERMAAAAYYFHLRESSKSDVTLKIAIDRISAIRSDNSADHNPMEIPLFLVTGTCRKNDREILSQRLISLNAHLIAVSLR